MGTVLDGKYLFFLGIDSNVRSYLMMGMWIKKHWALEMTRCILVGGRTACSYMYRHALASLGTRSEMAFPKRINHRWSIGFRPLIHGSSFQKTKEQRNNLPAVSVDCAAASQPFFCPLNGTPKSLSSWPWRELESHLPCQGDEKTVSTITAPVLFTLAQWAIMFIFPLLISWLLAVWHSFNKHRVFTKNWVLKKLSTHSAKSL